MHKLDDDTLVTPALLKRFADEAELEDGNGAFYALIQKSDGAYLGHAMGPGLDALQMMFAQDVSKMLNRELHHDGAWVACFTHWSLERLMYDRMCWIFVDKDGDPQFTIDWVHNGHHTQLDFPELMADGPVSWCALCEAAYEQYDLMMRQLLRQKAGQTYKRAKGERAPTAH